ncbi:MAG: hypothetical protein Q7U71_06035, partial [bacterium]|nr:hypothetical protein [bacterium]
ERYKIKRLVKKKRILYIGMFSFFAITIIMMIYYYGNLFSFFMDSKLIIMLVSVCVPIGLFVWDLLISRKPENEISESRIQRHREILEEKLKKLEMLKTADLEILINSKNQIK